jgi:hypothetical protein
MNAQAQQAAQEAEMQVAVRQHPKHNPTHLKETD